MITEISEQSKVQNIMYNMLHFMRTGKTVLRIHIYIKHTSGAVGMLPCRGRLLVPEDILGCHTAAADRMWAEAKGAAKQPTRTEQHPQQRISQTYSGEVEKPCFRGTREKYSMGFSTGYHRGRESGVGRLFTLPF